MAYAHMDKIIVPPVLRISGRNLRTGIRKAFNLAKSTASTASGPQTFFFIPPPPPRGGGGGGGSGELTGICSTSLPGWFRKIFERVTTDRLVLPFLWPVVLLLPWRHLPFVSSPRL